ncbi:hypothetical protein, partial [Elizabethkingia anophelis]|uniref:hypothetical protein n=1 Tax=Elizabethkingia anophelis TaxID=1117645 RepID=UPI001C893A6E
LFSSQLSPAPPQQLSLFGTAKVEKLFRTAKTFLKKFLVSNLFMISALTLIKKVTTKIGQLFYKKQIGLLSL